MREVDTEVIFENTSFNEKDPETTGDDVDDMNADDMNDEDNLANADVEIETDVEALTTEEDVALLLRVGYSEVVEDIVFAAQTAAIFSSV